MNIHTLIHDVQVSALGLMVRKKALRHNRLSKAEIRQVQQRKLELLLRCISKHVPYYSKHFAHLKEAPRELEAVPIVNKKIIMERFSDFLSAPSIELDELKRFEQDLSNVGRHFRDRYLLSVTSGTTGTVGYFLSDARAESARYFLGRARMPFPCSSLWIANLKALFLGPPAKLASLVATSGHYTGNVYNANTPLLLRNLLERRIFSIHKELSTTVRELNEYGPDQLHGYATTLETIAHEQISGRLRISPWLITTTSEALTVGARQALNKAFPSAFVYEFYSTSECGRIAQKCREGRWHVNEDFCILEAVDSENRAVPPGVPSAKVLLTNLENRIQPIVRYELTDSITYTGVECSCRSPFSVIELEGRADESLFLENGAGSFVRITPPSIATILAQIRGLRQYQVVHESQNQLEIRYSPANQQELETIESDIRQELGSLFRARGIRAQVSLRFTCYPEGLPKDPNRKFRQIYSLVASPESYVP